MLILAISCLLLVDYRYKLAFFINKKACLVTISISVFIFSIWDILGIQLGIFFEGQTKYLTGLNLIKDFPVEELFFLTLLCYTTLILINGINKNVHISNS